MSVGLFLEDIAQERFISAIVERVGIEVGIPSATLILDIRNAIHGSKAIQEYKRFLKDCVNGHQPPFDLIVVAIDGNCRGHPARTQELERFRDAAKYAGEVVYAVPDPHIEKWYMIEPAALKAVLKSNATPQLPPYKCERDRYKRELIKVIRESGTIPLLGGAELGAEIANGFNLESACKADPSFRAFISTLRDQLRRCLRVISASPD